MQAPAEKTTIEQAQSYVGIIEPELYPIVGQLQLDLLLLNGCAPTHNVLEIGCGCLVAGSRIMDYLEAERYVAIEPNQWLIETAKASVPGVAETIERKRPTFVSNLDFDASETGRRFDFVISHSILSHAAHWQLPLFFRNVKKVLAPGGLILASIRFYDGDRLVGDSHDEEWVYPGVSYFAWSTVCEEAAKCGLHPEWRRDYKRYFTTFAPPHFHDWIRLTHVEDTASRGTWMRLRQLAIAEVRRARHTAARGRRYIRRRLGKLLQG